VGASGVVQVAAFFFGARTGAVTGAGACDVAGLSTYFFLGMNARAEDGEEGLPSPSLLRFLDGQEVGNLFLNYEMSY
jgi:hypothetical protein